MQYRSTHFNPRKEQFRQNFEDSQANYSDVSGQHMNNSSGRPVQLIKIERNGQIVVGEEALEIIASYGQPVGFASLAGKTRTGKSCLLNRLLHIKGQGFRVDSSTSSCTEGIWMWSDPFRNDKYHNLIFFIDTEGTDSLVKDPQNDTKIFTLAVLISSFFIYNSVGSIDERSLGELEMVTALSKKIRTGEGQSDSGQLIRFMPKFMWLLRDFMLQIEDRNFKKISPNTYLQNCLSNQQDYGGDSTRIKKSILTYFPIRQCLTLVRPVYEEQMIYNLNELEDNRLRGQFLQGVNTLRNKIIDGTGPKIYGGSQITGSGMAVMIQSYVQAFNNGSVPNIRSAWEQITIDQGNEAYRKALDVYEVVFEEEFGNQQPQDERQLDRKLKRLRSEAMNKFKDEAGNNIKDHREQQRKLQGVINQNESQIIDENNKLCQQHNLNLIAIFSQGIKAKLESQYYKGSEGAAELSNDIEQCKAKYNEQAVGRGRGEALTQFVTTLTPMIMLIQSSGQGEREAEERERLRIAQQEADRKRRMDLQRDRSKEAQLGAKERAQGIKGRKASRKDAEQQKQGKTGCCGGKCQIM